MFIFKGNLIKRIISNHSFVGLGLMIAGVSAPADTLDVCWTNYAIDGRLQSTGYYSTSVCFSSFDDYVNASIKKGNDTDAGSYSYAKSPRLTWQQCVGSNDLPVSAVQTCGYKIYFTGTAFVDDNAGNWMEARLSFKCGVGQRIFNNGQNRCFSVIDADHRDPPSNGHQCGVGNPVYPLTGTKRQPVETGLALGSRPLNLTYDSARAPWTSNGSNSLPGEVALSGDAGLLWWNSLHRQLYVSPNGLSLKASRGNGTAVDFALQGNTWVAGADTRTIARDQRDTLVASATGFIYWDQASLTQEKYNTAGQMLNWVNASGMSLTPTFTGSNFTKLSDPFGRNITLSYKSVTVGASSQTVIDTITTPDSRSIVAGYDANANLTSLTWPDQSVKTLVYDSVNANQSWALTGIIDEASKRFATFGYDPIGRAISTEHAGGVNKYSVSWANGAGPQVAISEVYDQANNVVRRYHDWTVPQAPVVTGPTGTLETFNAPGRHTGCRGSCAHQR